jgi:hypothetical protein
MSKLPDKPSELIRVALTDLAKCEAMPEKYQVHMRDWHTPLSSPNVCSVCLAGAVMAQTLGADIGVELDPDDFADVNKLCALDDLRIGDVVQALWLLGLVSGSHFYHDLNRKITDYEASPTMFREEMNKLADELEKAGL